MITRIIESFIQLLVQLAVRLANFGIGLLPQSVIDFLNSNAFFTMIDFIGDITWFMPIYGMFGIITTVVALLAIIRLVRWIIGLVPTIEG